MKKPSNIDISVLMLFFNRPESFRQVFAEVKRARPARLFLYQDGARNDADKPNIEACRKIAEDIDWECEVYRNYKEENQGCDPSGYLAQRWAFSLSDKVMVLEDDVVPSQSFFVFCKEMLDRYEHDERISMIAGFNIDEKTDDVPYDYFFTSVFSIWGWASWRRVVDKWDGEYSFMDDRYAMTQLENVFKERRYAPTFMSAMQRHRESGVPHFESIFWSSMLLNNGLAIMPSVNMINNVGAVETSTHYSTLDNLPRALRRIFTMGRYDIGLPLRHPPYIIENVGYKHRLYHVNAWGHPWIKFCRSLEELWLNTIHGNFSFIVSQIKRRADLG